MSEERKRELYKNGWHLDTHSTILSRRHSYHMMAGKMRYVKPKKQQ